MYTDLSLAQWAILVCVVLGIMALMGMSASLGYILGSRRGGAE